MKAVILAGGLGTRLAEETYLRPKPMVEVGDKPMLWHILKTYSHYGINEFITCSCYKNYIINEYFTNYFLHTSYVSFHIARNHMKIHKQNPASLMNTLVDAGEAPPLPRPCSRHASTAPSGSMAIMCITSRKSPMATAVGSTMKAEPVRGTCSMSWSARVSSSCRLAKARRGTVWGVSVRPGARSNGFHGLLLKPESLAVRVGLTGGKLR